MNINEILKGEFNLKNEQIENVIKSIDEGNTIPFIARYRKEMTGEMSDIILRQFNDRLNYLRNLQSRKEDVQRIIGEQGKLTDEIIKNLAKANTLQEVEDIYAPFKQKKRTRATIALEKGDIIKTRLPPLTALITKLFTILIRYVLNSSVQNNLNISFSNMQSSSKSLLLVFVRF